MPSMGEFMSLDVADGVGTIRLDRPKMNAISFQVQAELRSAAAEATERDDVRAVVLYGGGRGVAAGDAAKGRGDPSYAARGAPSPSRPAAGAAAARVPR